MTSISRKILLFVLPSFLFLTAEAWPQSQESGQERSVRYIGKTQPTKTKTASARRNKTRTIILEKSSIADTAEHRVVERKTFDLINEKRRKFGLATLKWNPELADLAREHSKNMAVHGFLSHLGLNGRTVDSRATDFGIDSWKAIGENIAFSKGILNPAEFTVSRWMNSTGHKRNLLDQRWRDSGIGVAVTEDGKYFFTQIFVMRD